MEILFWGATDDVTGSMTFLKMPTGYILIDCGLAQGETETEEINHMPLPILPTEIKAVIITHAHLDHSGYLPRLVKKGFNGQIFCTPATAKLMRIILLDSAKINEDKFYEKSDVTQTLNMVKTHDWEDRFEVLGTSVTFIPAGHILGASSVVIKTKDKKIVFSGDLGRSDDPLLPPPQPCPQSDIIVMESTYGGKNRTGDIEKELHSFLATVAEDSRIGIIASFAVARAQNLLTLIHQFYERHPDKKVRVVFDSPMMKEANKVYQQYAHLTNYKEDLYEALDEVDAIEHQKEWSSLKRKSGPLIILSSSGMLTGGRIARHLYNWHDEKSAILLLPGYQGTGTPGRSLLEGSRSLKGPDGQPFEWSGEVWGSDAFSSHADQAELIEWATKNNTKSKIFILHGERSSKEAFKKKLEDIKMKESSIPERGTQFRIE